MGIHLLIDLSGSVLIKRVINLEEKPGSSWINNTLKERSPGQELEPCSKPGPDVKSVKLVLLSGPQLQHLDKEEYGTNNCQSPF